MELLEFVHGKTSGSASRPLQELKDGSSVLRRFHPAPGRDLPVAGNPLLADVNRLRSVNIGLYWFCQGVAWSGRGRGGPPFVAAEHGPEETPHDCLAYAASCITGCMRAVVMSEYAMQGEKLGDLEPAIPAITLLFPSLFEWRVAVAGGGFLHLS
jgi:hypothetical protein